MKNFSEILSLLNSTTTEIDLSNIALTSNDMALLIQKLQGKNDQSSSNSLPTLNIRILNLSNCQLHNVINELKQLITLCASTLKCLVLASNKLTSQMIVELQQSIASCSVLEELDISNNRLGPTGAFKIAEAIVNIASFHTLNVNAIELGRRNLESFLLVLKDKKLRSLSIARNIQSKNNTFNEIKNFSEEKPDPDAVALGKWLDSQSSLLQLDFSGNMCVQGDCSLIFLSHIPKSLHTLKLADTQCAENMPAFIPNIEALPNLSMLDISHQLLFQQFLEQEWKVLLNAFPHFAAMRVLNLSFGKLLPSAIEKLAKALPDIALETLLLNDNPLGEGVQSCIDAIAKHKTIKNLHLGNTQITHLEKIQHLTQLEKIDLRDNCLDESSIHELILLLKNSKRLYELDISNLKLPEHELSRILIDGVNENKTLLRLYIYGNQITNRILEILKNLVEKHSSLLEIILVGHDEEEIKTLTNLNQKFIKQIADVSTKKLHLLNAIKQSIIKNQTSSILSYEDAQLFEKQFLQLDSVYAGYTFNEQGDTLLHLAARYGNAPIMKLVLNWYKTQASHYSIKHCNAKGQNIFDIANYYGNYSLMVFLLNDFPLNEQYLTSINQVELFRQMLINFYQSEFFTAVELLGGNDDIKLTLRDIYVNLTVVQEAAQAEHEKNLFEEVTELADDAEKDINLLIYQNIHREKKIIDLKELFKNFEAELNKTKSQLNTEKPSKGKKTLLLGRRGAGKSTMLRSLTLRTIEGEFLTNFKFVFHIDLKLIAQIPTNLLQDIPTVLKEYFSLIFKQQGKKLDIDQNKFLGLLISRAKDINPDDAIWFLDSFDEVQFLNHPHIENVLLKQKYCFLGSRHHSVEQQRNNADEILECLGLTRENINHYIDKFFSKAKTNQQHKAKELKNLLQQQPNLMAMCDIPLYLQLLCILKLNDSKVLKDIENFTLIDLHAELEKFLMQRMLDKLAAIKVPPQRYHWSQHRWYEQAEAIFARLFLSRLAFESMKTGKPLLEGVKFAEIFQHTINEITRLSEEIEFSTLILPDDYTQSEYKLIKKKLIAFKEILLSSQENEGVKNLDLLTQLMAAGFLKNIGTSNNYELNNFYFTHYSSYEFFVALYLAYHFEAEREFIAKHKYDPAWKIWHLIAGILKNDAKRLNQFFLLLLEPPRDLFGMYEVVLLAQCLDACGISKKLDVEMRNHLIQYSQNWVKASLQHAQEDPVISEMFKLPRLVQEAQFEAIVLDFAKNPALIFCCKQTCLRALKLLPKLSAKSIAFAITAANDPNENVRNTALDLLASLSEPSGEVVKILNEHKKKSNSQQFNTASNIVDIKTTDKMLEENQQIDTLIKHINSTNQTENNRAQQKFEQMLEENPKFLDKLLLQLKTNSLQRHTIILAFAQIKKPSKKIIEAALELSGDHDETIRHSALLILSRVPDYLIDVADVFLRTRNLKKDMISNILRNTNLLVHIEKDIRQYIDEILHGCFIDQRSNVLKLLLLTAKIQLNAAGMLDDIYDTTKPIIFHVSTDPTKMDRGFNIEITKGDIILLIDILSQSEKLSGDILDVLLPWACSRRQKNLWNPNSFQSGLQESNNIVLPDIYSHALKAISVLQLKNNVVELHVLVGKMIFAIKQIKDIGDKGRFISVITNALSNSVPKLLWLEEKYTRLLNKLVNICLANYHQDEKHLGEILFRLAMLPIKVNTVLTIYYTDELISDFIKKESLVLATAEHSVATLLLLTVNLFLKKSHFLNIYKYTRLITWLEEITDNLDSVLKFNLIKFLSQREQTRKDLISIINQSLILMAKDSSEIFKAMLPVLKILTPLPKEIFNVLLNKMTVPNSSLTAEIFQFFSSIKTPHQKLVELLFKLFDSGKKEQAVSMLIKLTNTRDTNTDVKNFSYVYLPEWIFEQIKSKKDLWETCFELLMEIAINYQPHPNYYNKIVSTILDVMKCKHEDIRKTAIDAASCIQWDITIEEIFSTEIIDPIVRNFIYNLFSDVISVNNLLQKLTGIYIHWLESPSSYDLKLNSYYREKDQRKYKYDDYQSTINEESYKRFEAAFKFWFENEILGLEFNPLISLLQIHNPSGNLVNLFISVLELKKSIPNKQLIPLIIKSLANIKFPINEIPSKIFELAEDDDPNVRFEICNFLAQYSDEHPTIMKILWTYSQDREYFIRRVAILALGRFLNYDGPSIVVEFQDKNSEHKSELFHVIKDLSMRFIESRTTSLTLLLLKSNIILNYPRLTDGTNFADPDYVAIQTLAKFAHPNVDVIRVLLTTIDLEIKNQELNNLILNSLAKIVYPPEEVIEILLKRVNDKNMRLRKVVMDVLSNIHNPSVKVVNALLMAAEHDKNEIKFSAMLKKVQETNIAIPTYEQVRQWLATNNWEDRCVTIKMLGRFSNLPEDLLEILIEQATDRNLQIEKAVIEAICHQKDLNNTLVIVLLNSIVRNSHNDIRQMALERLTRLSNVNDEITEQLLKFLLSQNDLVPFVKLIETLEHISKPNINLTRQLLVWAKDSNQVIRQAALSTLNKIIMFNSALDLEFASLFIPLLYGYEPVDQIQAIKAIPFTHLIAQYPSWFDHSNIRLAMRFHLCANGFALVQTDEILNTKNSSIEFQEKTSKRQASGFRFFLYKQVKVVKCPNTEEVKNDSKRIRWVNESPAAESGLLIKYGVHKTATKNTSTTAVENKFNSTYVYKK